MDNMMSNLFPLTDNVEAKPSNMKLDCQDLNFPVVDPRQLSDLPNEILMKILALVPTGDLLQNVARVSKRFHDITRQPALHVDVHLNHRCDQNGAVSFLKECYYLRSLTINEAKPLVWKDAAGSFYWDRDIPAAKFDSIILALLELENVESISSNIQRGRLQVKPATIIQLATANWWRHISKLQISIMYPKEGLYQDRNAEFDEAFSALENSNNLKHLAIDATPPMSEDSLMPIVTSCPNLKYVRDFGCSDLSDLELVNLIKFLSNRSERLDFSLYGHGGKDSLIIPKEVCAALSLCKLLKNLNLGSGFTKLAFLANLPKLTTLKIRNSQKLDWINLCGSIRSRSLPTVKKMTILQTDWTLYESDEDGEEMLEPPHEDQGSEAFNVAFSAILASACPNLRWLKVCSFSSCSQLIPFFESCPDLQVVVFKSKHHDQDPEMLVDLICAPQSKVEYLESTYLRISKEQAQRMLYNSTSLQGLLTKGQMYIKNSMSLDQLASLIQNVMPRQLYHIQRVAEPKIPLQQPLQ